MMTRFALLLAMLCAFTLSAQSSEIQKFLELKKLVDENEPKAKWRRINWHGDINAALKEAQKQDKPLLVFMLVNESGKTDAARC